MKTKARKKQSKKPIAKTRKKKVAAKKTTKNVASAKSMKKPTASQRTPLRALIISAQNVNDLTKEDYEALGPKDLSLDMGDDEQLKHRATPVDFTGKDLDIPGSELDDDSEAVGSEDEENNSYSLGGDNHEDLEEDRS